VVKRPLTDLYTEAKQLESADGGKTSQEYELVLKEISERNPINCEYVDKYAQLLVNNH